MATAKTTTTEPADAPKTKIEKTNNPVEANEPYPTGDPKTPQTWAEINGLVPTGTGPLAPAEPPVAGG